MNEVEIAGFWEVLNTSWNIMSVIYKEVGG